MATTAGGLPYVEPSDLVSGWPAVSQSLAEELDDQLAAKASLAGATYTGTHNFTGATVTGVTGASAVASVATEQTTSSTSYTDLATAGPAVTLTTGTKALVIVSANLWNNNATVNTLAGFAVSGATTVAASDTYALNIYSGSGVTTVSASFAYIITGLTAGSNTFTMKYRVSGGTGNYRYRSITVVDMGS